MTKFIGRKAEVSLLKDVIRSLEADNEVLRASAGIDFLTGAGNRMAFSTALDIEVSRVQREAQGANRQDFSVVYLDLDGFKAFNDREGHPAGDELLKRFVGVIKENSRGVDQIFRMGGDEFVVLLPGANHIDAYAYVRKIRAKLSREGIPVSAGVCGFEDAKNDKDTMISIADRRMYLDKRSRAAIRTN